MIVKVRLQNRGNASLDWVNALDGRSSLLVGDKSFNHNGDAERTFPGALLLGEIPPDGYQERRMVYEVTSASLDGLDAATLALVSTEQLGDGEDPTTASSIGLVHLPRPR